jgi:hypothetical protein
VLDARRKHFVLDCFECLDDAGILGSFELVFFLDDLRALVLAEQSSVVLLSDVIDKL